MKRKNESRIRAGSALILVVVLTSLLAIVGVMFVMVARVDRIATSAISENKTLNFAVETIVARISQELVLDVPGVEGQEYYDYPGQRDRWLASLEPHKDGGYKWRQISDVTGYIEKVIPDVKESWDTEDIVINNDAIIEDHEEIELDDDGNIEGPEGQLADADGDGVADSKWIELEGINSSKGKTIYAAIRVIDNGGMLNVNTAYQFNPASPGTDGEYIDGSEQMQINLMALSWRPGHTTYEPQSETDLLKARANDGVGVDHLDLDEYERNVIWRYNEPNGAYTPFDISDELELRYRFLINHKDIDSRLEELGPIGRRWGFREYAFRTPAETGDLDEWFISAYDDGSLDPNYAYRHIGTTYNMDRIINPDGEKMVWVNNPAATASEIFTAIQSAFNSIPSADWVIPTLAERDAVAAQLAVNIADYVDDDLGVQTQIDAGGTTYYGFEAQPFITEIGIKIGANPLDDTTNHFAVELYNPFNVSIPLDDFKLVLVNEFGVEAAQIALAGEVINANSYYVVVNHSGQFAVVDNKVDNDLVLADNYFLDPISGDYTCNNYNILLTRDVAGPTIYVDRQDTIKAWFTQAGLEKYLERDDDGGHILYQHVADVVAGGSIGAANIHTVVLGWKFNLLPFDESQFVTVGDVARMLIIGPSDNKDATVGQQLENAADEEQIRVNLENPDFRNIFQYLTVFDPSSDGIDNDGDWYTDETNFDKTPEFKIPGRININTAPWYVIAQLPWVSNELAQAIVAYRDKLDSPIDYSDPNTGREDATDIDGIRETAGFASIGELATVVNDSDEDEYSMHYYELDSNDLEDFPDLTPSDGAEDDFEERDVIFARLSNLVTVRSDVFTAYILVRIGADGPQKRVMAILDRSDVYTDDGRVQIVALHPVADPR